ncbi:hypothetical protein Tco_0116770 [Tanacetum coccineum]
MYSPPLRFPQNSSVSSTTSSIQSTFRREGQDTQKELEKSDLKAELEEREWKHFSSKDKGRNGFEVGEMTVILMRRLPILKGDKWWRGHARAFLKYVNFPVEALPQGRVCQKRREASYFVVDIHHIKSGVICAWGTETAEDLLTDGLSREHVLAT